MRWLEITTLSGSSGSSSAKPQNVMGETDNIDDLLNGVAAVLLEVVTGVAGYLAGVAGVACFLAGMLAGDGLKNTVMGFWQAEDSMLLRVSL